MCLKKLFPSLFINKDAKLFKCEICQLAKHNCTTYSPQPYKPTDDAFSTGTGIERAGFAGPVSLLWALDSSAKTRNKKDRRGLARYRSDT